MNNETRQAALLLWDLSNGGDRIPIWVDCDTGHDDAFAILMAAHSPKLKLLGVSTVHGNASLQNTTKNSLSILEAIGKRDIPVYPGAAKPFCREAVHAEAIHGGSGLDGTTILPEPVLKARITSENSAVHAMYHALVKTAPGTGWLVATGALTNVALLFTVYPSLIEHIAGLSIMGGAIGGFFTHAPLGRVRDRIQLSERLHQDFPSGLPDDSGMPMAEVVKHFRALGLLKDADDATDEGVHLLLEEARHSFGNWTPYAEFNIYCDPEAAASIFTSARLAAKTTLIPLDVTHQVLADEGVMKLLHGKRPDTTAIRHLFKEILTFFASTYEREFAMTTGPPLHDPIAVAAALAPSMFDDNDGERYEVHVVRDGDDSLLDHRRNFNNVGQCGRTIARLLPKGQVGIRIPRTLKVAEFWHMIDLSLSQSEKASPLTFKR